MLEVVVADEVVVTGFGSSTVKVETTQTNLSVISLPFSSATNRSER